MLDTAEAYAKGNSEIEMYVPLHLEPHVVGWLGDLSFNRDPNQSHHRGRVIKELGLRRADLVITTKIFWGPRGGHHGGGLSRKQ